MSCKYWKVSCFHKNEETEHHTAPITKEPSKDYDSNKQFPYPTGDENEDRMDRDKTNQDNNEDKNNKDKQEKEKTSSKNKGGNTEKNNQPNNNNNLNQSFLDFDNPEVETDTETNFNDGFINQQKQRAFQDSKNTQDSKNIQDWLKKTVGDLVL
jgi:hypothetical protein